MLKEERHLKILEKLETDKRVTLDTLSILLGVSLDTARRDLKELAEGGLLKAVRGGAMHAMPPPFAKREQLDVISKNLIAQKVVSLIKPNQVIFIDAGTTTSAAAAALPRNMPLTVFTNSFPVASTFMNFPQIDVFFAGGHLNRRTFSSTGPGAIEVFQGVQAHLCLLGICSIDIKKGVTGIDYQDVMVKRVMVNNSRFVAALTTFDKVGRYDPYLVCEISNVNYLITEEDPTNIDLTGYADAGINLI